MCSPQGEQVEHLPQASLLKGRFGGIVNMTGVAKQSFATPFIRKNATLNTNLTHRAAQPDSNCGPKSESRPR